MYLTISELADLLKVSEQTIRKYAKNGEIPIPLKIGGSPRWDANELREFIKAKNQPIEVTNEN